MLAKNDWIVNTNQTARQLYFILHESAYSVDVIMRRFLSL
jgi:hypothetical protein